MLPEILLVNPPIYDFAAYDFWLKPYGLLSAAAHLRPAANMTLFDFLDRHSRYSPPNYFPAPGRFGKGHFPKQAVKKPPQFASIPRKFSRYGIERAVFQDFLKKNAPFDHVLIQTSMTYWYPGIKEVISDIHNYAPKANIVLGGVYATLCPAHALSLGANMVIQGSDLTKLLALTGEKKQNYQPPLWQLYDKLDFAVMKLTKSCPYNCSYCAVHRIDGDFATRELDNCIADLDLLMEKGVKNIAFYDDALLYKPEKTLIPFLKHVISKNLKINFHTPNALHARYITPELAEMMVTAGFKTFYLGFESKSSDFHSRTGSKVVSDELITASENLIKAGAQRKNIVTYQMLGHPSGDLQQLEESMMFANSLGLKIMLSDFSPIPGTPDGDICNEYVDLTEPLNHNKTAFPIIYLGIQKVNRLKNLCKQLNKMIK